MVKVSKIVWICPSYIKN